VQDTARVARGVVSICFLNKLDVREGAGSYVKSYRLCRNLRFVKAIIFMSPRAAELHQQKLLALMRAGRFLDGVHEDTNKRGCGEK
jgi:hypothetical protein